MPQTIVTFTSDFGYQDWFVGVLHGVLHALAPEARIVDLNHTIPPGMIERAAFVLEAASGDFPPGTVHLGVVDPGVGTRRRAIVASARGQVFVGPDNGLLEWALAAPDVRIHALVEERYFRAPVSRTFHGRDVFAPVAAHVVKGVPLESFGPRITDPVRLTRPVSRRVDGELEGRIAFIDRFGNALTNLTAESLMATFAGTPETDFEIGIAGRKIRGLARSYGDAPVGTLVAIIGSSGRLEVAQVGGDVAERLGIGEGDPVTVRVSRG